MSISPRELILLEALEDIEALIDDPNVNKDTLDKIWEVFNRGDVVSAMVAAHNASGRAE